MKKVMVLGGDGFCGWPASLYLSKQGYDVVIIDNFSRRKIDIKLGTDSLTPIYSLYKRLEAWNKFIPFYYLNLDKEYDRFLNILKDEKPDAIVHFAEQRSAPYSMKSSKEKRYTVNNNVNVTNNVLNAIVDSGLDIHLVHLGTMGVYGYDGDVPEGYIDYHGRKALYPSDPGSVYHTTKVIDQWLFYFFNKNNHIRITDLHQGIVWGTQTDETASSEYLINRFDYDSDYGTVLNRFLMQAAIGHPLTVYGTGGQTRAFIHIKDMVQCIKLAIENPSNEGVKIANQVTDVYSILELANIVSRLTGATIEQYHNPRKERAENTLNVDYSTIRKWGLNPTTLKDGLLKEIVEIADKYKDRCDKLKIMPTSIW